MIKITIIAVKMREIWRSVPCKEVSFRKGKWKRVESHEEGCGAGEEGSGVGFDVDVGEDEDGAWVMGFDGDGVGKKVGKGWG